MPTAPTVAHADFPIEASGSARRIRTGRSNASTIGLPDCADDSKNRRRAYRFLLASSYTITPMATEDLDDVVRVGVLIRMQIPVHEALRTRAARERISVNGYLERLVRRNLGDDADDFVLVPSPRFAAKGKNGTGRPTKGVRAGVTLRVSASLRQLINERAKSLHLTANDYLESLVSIDISAVAPAGEEMAFDQTA